MTMKRFIQWLMAGVAAFATAQAAEVRVAVAANFTAPMKQIAQSFEQETGHKSVLSFGSTGNLYAQIRNGAPFDALLSADDETPRRLEQEGLALAGTRFTYAIGRLVLWSPLPDFVDAKGDVLRKGTWARLAVANPKLAPYGAAAMETLDKLGLTQVVQPRLVQGENIAQTYQFVMTGNAPLGFVALSQVVSGGKLTHGSAWIVPDNLHAPIQQEAVLLSRSQGNPAAQALMAHLRSDKVRALIQGMGYQR